MTISSTVSRWEAVGNGSTTVFPYTNKIFADTDLKVYLDGVLQTLTTHYTVSGAGTDAGGNVTFLTAPTNGASVVIVRDVANTQLIDYPAAGAFPSVATEDGLDRRTIISQQNVSRFDRAIQYLESDANLPSPILPTLDTLKGRYLKFNASTGAPEAGVFDSGTTSRVVDQFTGDGSTVTFTLSTGVGAAGTTIDVFVDGVYQDPDTYTAASTFLTFTEAPPAPTGGGSTNIVAIIAETVPIGETSADLVAYTPQGTGATVRAVQDRLRDHAQAEDFGTLQQAVDTGRTIFFGPGTYTGSVTLPTGMGLEADATADLTGLTFTGSLRKGNRFTFSGDYEATLGQLNHPQSPSGAAGTNVGNSWQNALTVVRGTATNPDTTALYARTAAYVEMHNDKVHTTNQSVWGGPYKVGALCVEHVAHANFEGAAHGGVFRAYSTDPPASADDSKKNLVGMSSIGQTNPGAGNTCHNVWGANIIAAQTSGNTREACVGIEVDVLHTLDAVAGSGPTTGNNYTAYWAQSDASGVYSTAAFWASRSSGSLGWNYVLYSQTRARDWMAYLDNSETTVTTASGIYAKIASSSGTVMKLDSGANTQFQVGVGTTNPVSVRVGGALKALEVGAADSAGAGYRTVRVLN